MPTTTAEPPPSARPPARLSARDAAMLLVTAIWGVNFSVTKGAFATFPPLAFTAVRFAAASMLLVPILRRLEGEAAIPRPVLIRLAVLGVIGNTLYQLAFIVGLDHTTASNSALILAAMPSVVAVLAGALGLERVTPRMGWGIAVASLGVVLVVAARGGGLANGTILGDGLTVAAVLCWATYTLGLRTLPSEISPLRVTTIATVAGTPGLLLAGIPDLRRTDWSAIGWAGWGALSYATVLSLVVAYLLWNRSVRDAGPSRTVVFMCITPIVAVTAAWAILGERPVPLQAAGALLVIGGVLLTRR